MVRLSLLHLALGATLGTVLMAAKGGSASPGAWRLLPVHRELLLMGWLLQMAGGVGWWILPRRGGSRGPAVVARSACGLLNLGVAAVAVAGVAALPALAAAGRAAELTAVVLLAVGLWPRVRTTRVGG